MTTTSAVGAGQAARTAAGTKWDPVADLSPVQVDVPASDPNGKPTTALVFLCRFPGCGRQFQLKGNLKRHQNIHSGEKQFRCDFCGRSFLRKADMEVHLRVHTGEKPYECKHGGCGKRFARRSDLLSHERTHTGNKPFACEFPGCGRRFARRFDLHKHERSHDEETSRPSAAPKKKSTMKRRLAADASAKRSAPVPGDHSQDDQDDTTTQDDDDEGLTSEATGNETPRTQSVPSPSQRTIVTTSASVPARGGTSGFVPISPTDHASGPGKDFHFELTCTEDHIHISPDCFSKEEWDTLLGTSAPATACCPEHLQSIAESFATAHAHAHIHDSFHQSMGVVDSYPHPHAGGRIPCYTPGSRSPPQCVKIPSGSVHAQAQQSQLQPDLHLSPLRSTQSGSSSSFSPSRAATDSMTSQLSSTSLNSPCPVAAKAKLHDYAAHTSCGHLAIQHGDHRDFVVKNHLVCVDNVKSLTGDCGGAHPSACTKPKQASSQPAPKCAPQDPHRPGCGHLAVRHGDHIDYVVEDNLFCQLAGGLMEDAGNIELLDDDFWDFYGAIGSLKTE